MPKAPYRLHRADERRRRGRGGGPLTMGGRSEREPKRAGNSRDEDADQIQDRPQRTGSEEEKYSNYDDDHYEKVSEYSEK